MSDAGTNDLVVLVADTSIKAVVQAILERPKALQIREISFEIYVHPDRDPGCRTNPHAVLTRPLSTTFRCALVVFDRQGSGGESSEVAALETHVTDQLARAGWNDRAAAVAIDPELEVWVWADSPHVADALGWTGRDPALRDWLAERGVWPRQDAKPPDPKRAVEMALHKVHKPRSSSRYHRLAAKVSLARCTDPSFGRFRSQLQTWFSP